MQYKEKASKYCKYCQIEVENYCQFIKNGHFY